MDARSLIIVIAVIGVSACANIPQGPPLTYEQLLPNTYEDPAWARNRAQSEPAPVPQPAEPAPAAAPR